MGLTVAIVGRPNVGKSALFNRLVGRRIALVDDTPGVTRDRRVHAAKLRDLFFDVVDTAGLEERDAVSLSGRMRAQTELAIDTSDLILFVIDARTGVTPSDSGFAELVRRSGKPVVLVANKMEFRAGRSGMLEAYSLGLGDPVPVSAEHGDGMADLRDAMVDAVGPDSFVQQEEYCEEPGQSAREGIDENTVVTEPEEVESYDETRPLFTAIVGRPNAGKSTLINALVGEQRMLTGPEAGITRDSISVDWTWRERTIRLFDTAGMRRKSRVNEKLEKLSVADGLRAIRFAEVVVIVFDATVPFEKQDLQIVDLIVREGRAPVIAFNKWDLIEDPSTLLRELHEKTNRLLPQVRGLRTVPVSAETGRGLDRLMEAVIATHRVWNQRVSTGRLNRWLEEVQLAHPPPAVAGRRLKVKYISQIKTRPPGFAVSCSRPDAMPQSYVRYLVNGLREAFDLSGVPIRLVLRASDNPYAGKAKKSR